MRIVLYQPDLPHNLGSVMRLAACFGAVLHVVEPCGFPFDDKRIRLKSLDYGEHIEMIRHPSWDAFERHRREAGGRLVLSTTKGALPLYDFEFEPADWLLFGREGAGVPENVHLAADARVIIPMQPGVRSFNIAMAAAIMVSEAYRQRYFPRRP